MPKSMFEIVRFDDTVRRAAKSNRIPQMLEFPVNPELGPFLVSSTRSVVWVNRVSRDSRVRVAIRAREGIEREVLASILEMSLHSDWGNSHPLTTHGVSECVAHINSYGLGDLECLAASGTNLEGVQFGELPLSFVDWMPLDCVVILPVDRGFVGTMGVISETQAMVVVHNASRGVAIAWR